MKIISRDIKLREEEIREQSHGEHGHCKAMVSHSAGKKEVFVLCIGGLDIGVGIGKRIAEQLR